MMIDAQPVLPDRQGHTSIRDGRLPVTHARNRWRRQLLRLPILYKVLIANGAIVIAGAFGGTWLTAGVFESASPQSGTGLLLALSFVLLGVVVSVTVNYLVLRAAFQPLIALERAASAVRAGDLSARAATPTFGDPQLERLAATFNGTLEELARDRTELRSLASQVIRAQEEERKRISRELHDDTAQVLFAQLLRVTALKSSSSDEVRQTAAMLETSTAEALESVRRLALELRPPALDDLGLLAALGELAQRFGDQLDIPVDYQARGVRGRMHAEIELVLYRVAQEALTNAGKHSGASHVCIDLDRGPGDVTLSVRDDGGGFDSTATDANQGHGLGLGLFGMAERVDLVGGALTIWSESTVGTEIFAFIPLPSGSTHFTSESS